MVELVLHGVVDGQENSKCDEVISSTCDLFYTLSKGTHYDTKRLRDNRVMYSLLMYEEPGRPFISYTGRSGSYFGISLILKQNEAITNADDLFKSLKETYDKYIKNKIIQETPTSRKWMYPTLRDPNDTLATYATRAYEKTLQQYPGLIKVQQLPPVQRQSNRNY